jgi:pimeloyl-ACP methyl ester carboxylesterase
MALFNSSNSYQKGSVTTFLYKSRTFNIPAMNNLESRPTIGMPDPKTILIDQIPIRYYEQGRGDTILLLHGWPQTAYTWRFLIQKLSDNFRVIALDLPGTGESGPAEAYDTKAIAAVISHFIKKTGTGPVHLVGHDVGAWISTTFALYFGEQLKSLTVIDAGIPGLMPEAVFSPQNAAKIWQFYFHAIADIPELLTKGKEKEYLNWYFSTKSYVKSAITDHDLAVYVEAFRKKHGFDYYRSFNQSAIENLTADQKIRIPVLAVGAQYAIGDGIGMALRQVSDQVSSYNIADCGHYVPEERPDELTEQILSHIANIK